MSADIVELTELDDLLELAELFARVWGRPGEPPVSSDLLRALSHSGNYVAGARDGARLIGGVVGWLGGHPPNDLHMHSHILGVLPGTEKRGLGFAMKQHQRVWCLERGVAAIEWTFDPLVRRNAFFNLTKLGAGAARYLVDFYGTMDDGINAGDESDRLLVHWDLKSPTAIAAAGGEPAQPLRQEGAVAALSVGGNGEPVMREVDAPLAKFQVPDDIVGLRRERPEQARRWRQAVRHALGGAMANGYRVTGATRDGWYVLELPHG